ncbi:MOP flippase family protein [Shewanella mesophila]|uniref:MOP flippase family protein n=1 Tax=Shewanella mesophila TaxID=2864208 RepID=UPI001C657352|nr:MOP flippase family protein [Shewanella mesophila]QYJ85010.1 MOP flippase family protein [Shewanella mesophila]
MSQLKKQASWTLISSVVTAIVQMTQMVILARLVTVDEIGLLAIANIAIALVLVFQDMGLSNYLIHRQNTTSSENSALLFVSLCIGISLAVITVVISPFISQFYQQPKLTHLLSTASVNFAIIGVCSLFQASLVRNFKQKSLAKIEIVARIISFSFVIFYLFLFEINIIAIIYGTIVNAIIKLILFSTFRSNDFKFSYKPEWSIVLPACKFGIYQVGSQVINQLRTQADQIILGKLLGMEVLGFYSIAKELIMKPIRFIGPLISRLLLPRFAINQQNDAKTSQLHIKTIQVLSWCNCLIYAFISLLAYPIILLLYGIRYLESATLLAILGLFGMIRPLGGVFAALAQSRGRSDIEFGWNIIAGIIMTLAISIAALNGSALTVAITLSAIQVFLTLLSSFYFSYTLKLDTQRTFIKTIAIPLLISIAVTVLTSILATNLTTSS